MQKETIVVVIRFSVVSPEIELGGHGMTFSVRTMARTKTRLRV
jgi:hypothetical protein